MKKEQESKYIDNGGVKCPFCESDNITAHENPQFSGFGIFQDIYCMDCEKEWTDEYKLIGIEEKENA